MSHTHHLLGGRGVGGQAGMAGQGVDLTQWGRAAQDRMQQADAARFTAERLRGEAGLLLEDRGARQSHRWI